MAVQRVQAAHMQDDIRIAVIERAIAILRPINDVEVLDPPDAQPRPDPSILPRGFTIARMFADAFLDLTEQSACCVSPERMTCL